MTRSEFLRLTVGLGATIATLGCPGDDSGSDEGNDSSGGSSGTPTGGSADGGDDGSGDTMMATEDGMNTEDGPSTEDTADDSTSGNPTTGATDDTGSATDDTGDGSGSSSDSGGMVDCSNDPSVVIGTNHGHALTVPAADVEAGVEATYDIQGTSLHPHSVTLTAADFAELQANGSVSVTSTNNSAHDHMVTVTCE